MLEPLTPIHWNPLWKVEQSTPTFFQAINDNCQMCSITSQQKIHQNKKQALRSIHISQKIQVTVGNKIAVRGVANPKSDTGGVVVSEEAVPVMHIRRKPRHPKINFRLYRRWAKVARRVVTCSGKHDSHVQGNLVLIVSYSIL